MEDKTISESDVVHLARLALAARPQDVQLFIRRLAKRYRDTIPELGDQLNEILREAPTRQSPLRREVATTVPVDSDSRLHLVRIEHSPTLEVEPIWENVVKGRLDRIVQERKRLDELSRANLTPTRTIIFTGPPGVGKTLAARWLSHSIGRPLVILDLSAVMSSFLGRTGTNLRHVLDYAKSVDCVLLLDELDAVAKRRDDTHEIGELKRLVTVLLQEIDDWPATGLLIAATNHPELLDPAVWRRFELKIDFPMPDIDLVRKAVSTFLNSESSISEKWKEALAHSLLGLSFSDIEREIVSARRDAVIGNQDLERAFHELLARRMNRLSRAERSKTAATLVDAGLSQRQVHELTGVSRDTIRKATKTESKESINHGQ